MSRPTYLSYFAGGDLAGCGLRAAGYAPDTLVEYDPAIAEVAAANHPEARVLVADVTTVDPRKLERPDLFWASPVCTRASRANPARGETARDLALADAICLALRTLTPPTFCLENVREYRAFKSFGRIVACLSDLGYQYTITHVNSADMGVPQTRIRLILMAVRGGLVPHLPAPVPWQGWYSAVADIIDTLPESKFAEWQLARLDRLADHTLVNQRYDQPQGSAGRRPQQAAGDAPAMTITASDGDRAIRAFLVSGQNAAQEWGAGGKRDDEPAMTVSASFGNRPAHMPTAFIVNGQNDGAGRGRGWRAADEPALTVCAGVEGRTRAFIGHPTEMRDNSPGIRHAGDPVFTVGTEHKTPRAWLDEGRVVKMHPRALARFQSIPDAFVLPEKAGLATLVIGNAVPPLLAQRIGEAFLRRGAAVPTGAGEEGR